jgi:hypothetical protein
VCLRPCGVQAALRKIVGLQAMTDQMELVVRIPFNELECTGQMWTYHFLWTCSL